MEFTKTKLEILNEKLKKFLNLSTEEKNKIDNDEKYDGLFDIINEMSNIIISKDNKDGKNRN